MRIMLKRVAILALLGLLAAGGVLFIGARHVLLASLPRLDGHVALTSLDAEVLIERDALGVVRIRGGSLLDVASAQGFVDAQERFAQMDISRRRAAGELAALVGPAAIPMDRDMRPHDFRRRAEAMLDRLPDRHRLLLEAYAAGVNAGLADLDAPPWEHLLIRTRPEAWGPVDSLLVMFHMFDGLSLNTRPELEQGILVDTLPPEVVAFLTPTVTRWDAPIWPDPAASTVDAAIPQIPGPDLVDLRLDDAFPTLPGVQTPPAARDLPPDEGDEAPTPLADEPRPMPGRGSNNWAIAGARTTDGRAIVANDMHLGLLVPNTWMRIQLEWGDRRLAGVSLPGVPGVIAGSNGRLAWGFTNHYNDCQDFILVRTDPDDPDRYLTGDPDQPTEPFGERVETIEVRGADPVTLPIRTTRWGDVTRNDQSDRPLVLKWTAYLPEALNLDLFDVWTADTLEEGVRIMQGWGGPSQNVMIAADDGRIAWVISGWLPRRIGFDGSHPVPWSDPDVEGWQGQIDERADLVIIDPDDGVLYSANNRTAAMPVGGGINAAWPPPTRAARIRDVLLENGPHDERSSFDLALDTRAPSLDFYRDLLVALDPSGEEADAIRHAIDLAETWNGHADADQRGYRIIKAFRTEVHQAIFDPLTFPAKEVEPGYRYGFFAIEEPARQILDTRPPHLLSPIHSSWDDLLRSAAADALRTLKRSDHPIDAPWGEVNRSAIRHPISMAVPGLKGLLDMPSTPQAGDFRVVRMSRPSFGASERFSVSPGREEEGFLHMPAGPSGHFLSRHYRSGHDAWAEGRPLPFLADEAVHTLRLTPADPN